jgi:hypothetical protein
MDANSYITDLLLDLLAIVCVCVIAGFLVTLYLIYFHWEVVLRAVQLLGG